MFQIYEIHEIYEVWEVWIVIKAYFQKGFGFIK